MNEPYTLPPGAPPPPRGALPPHRENPVGLYPKAMYSE